MKRTRSITMLLLIALIVTMAASHITTALAFSVPTVTVTTSGDLLDAITNASEGDIIGVEGQITFDASMVLGDGSKNITIQKASPNRKRFRHQNFEYQYHCWF